MATDTTLLNNDLPDISLQTIALQTSNQGFSSNNEAKEGFSSAALKPSKNPPKRKLKLKEEQFAHNVLKTSNATAAYVETYSDLKLSSARSNASVLLNKHEVRERVIELLQANPETQIDNVLKHVGAHLAAKKEVIYNSAGDIKEIRDNAAQGAAQEKLLRLYGLMNKDSDGETTINNTFQADPVALERLAVELNILNKELMNRDLPDGEVIDVTASGEVLSVHRTETPVQGLSSLEQIGGGVGVCVGEDVSPTARNFIEKGSLTHAAIENREKGYCVPIEISEGLVSLAQSAAEEVKEKTPGEKYLIAKMRDKMRSRNV